MRQKYLIDTNVLIDIKLPDALIAATALSRNLVLVTGNERDFGQIQNLLMVNPCSL